jgi:hypothetical protein
VPANKIDWQSDGQAGGHDERDQTYDERNAMFPRALLNTRVLHSPLHLPKHNLPMTIHLPSPHKEPA